MQDTHAQKAKDSGFRYKVREKLHALETEERDRVKKRVMKECNISDSSYSRYINVRKRDTYDIPALVLLEFAKLLNVEVEDLKN